MKTPITDKLKEKGIEWVPIGRLEEMEIEKIKSDLEVERLRKALRRVAFSPRRIGCDEDKATNSTEIISRFRRIAENAITRL